MERLSGGQRQSIAVARSVFSNPKVLFLDEPLAALGVREGRMVLDLVLELKARRDVSIILIAHNYSQVFEVCDRINFLSGGRIVYDTATKDTTVAELVDLVSSGYEWWLLADLHLQARPRCRSQMRASPEPCCMGVR